MRNEHHILGYLHKIMAQCQKHIEAQPLLARHLEAELSHHCKLAYYTEHTVALQVDSPAWATRLHYAIPTLLENLPQEAPFKHIKNVIYHIQPAYHPIPLLKKKKATPPASQNTVLILQDAAKTCQDRHLSAAWLRLACTLKKNTL